ncbi:MAG: TonB-dependent receptor [Gammaproteobacteria bacterium]|nr:TonB-dependent receptor [Gammaproteobacteria bacterium]
MADFRIFILKCLRFRLAQLIAILLAVCADMASVNKAVAQTPAEERMQSKQQRINSLKKLSLRELAEITLDDVFDIFDALVTVKRVSVAAGTEQSARLAPAITSVITAQDIEAVGAASLNEVLETVPGIHASKSYLAYEPLYIIRGMSSGLYNPNALVLINGSPIKTLLTGSAAGLIWGTIPVNAIARIEVIRGPGSAIYGADAHAGVINIITKTKDDINGTEAGVRAGSFDTQNAWIVHGGRHAGFDTALALEYHSTEGHRQIIDADAQTSLDELHDTYASHAPAPVSLQQHNLDVRADVSRGAWRLRVNWRRLRDIGTGAGITPILDPDGRFTDDRYHAELVYHNPKFSRHWDVTAQLSGPGNH